MENQLLALVNGNLKNPHNILGMKGINENKKKKLEIRCYYKNAEKVILIDNKSKKRIKMKENKVKGIFEVKIDFIKNFQYCYEVTIDNNTWVTYDPYNFELQITEFDLHLFSNGTHYKIFDKLGSHLKTLQGVEGVTFAIWAPNAKRVSVIGDFNNWDGLRNPMTLHKSGGVWEIFIPGLRSGDKYKYEIKTEEDYILEKSDPYGFYFEVRPNKATVVYNEKDYKWSDNKWKEKVEKSDIVNTPINIYEVHLGSWAKNVEKNNDFLTYRELADELITYVLEMGYTHIELLPILEHPYDPSWGYQVTGYFAPTSRFGHPDDFKFFVDECHKNNIGVILDWVPAHFPKDEVGLAKFDGTCLYEHNNPAQGEHPDWGTLIFNYGRNEVKNFLISNALFWVEEYHIDGLRTDAVASMLYLDYGKEDGEWVSNEYGGRENLEAIEFIKHLNSIMQKTNKNILMIAEESTSWPKITGELDEGSLGFNLKWNMGWMNDFLSYIEKDPIHRKYDHHKLTFGMYYHYTEKFMLVLSHDEVVHGKKSMLDKMPGDFWQKCANLKLTYGFKMGHPGKKLLFMGQEFGQMSEWSEERSLDWHLLEYEQHRQIQQFVKDLNELYKKEKALWKYDFDAEGFSWIDCNDGNSSIITFTRKTRKVAETLVFVCNFTPVVHLNYNIQMPLEGKYEEILNSDNLKYGGSGVINEHILDSKNENDRYVEIKVMPLGVSVFKIK